MKGYREDQKAFRTLMANIMWHMRGSVSREDAWAMSSMERDDILKLIAERQKIVKETGLPLL